MHKFYNKEDLQGQTSFLEKDLPLQGKPCLHGREHDFTVIRGANPNGHQHMKIEDWRTSCEHDFTEIHVSFHMKIEEQASVHSNMKA